MNATIIVRGVWTIKALHDGRRCFATDYIDGLPENDQEKLHALLRRAAERGPPSNREKFGKVEGRIHEFKSYQDRLFCFYGPNKTIIITHGFRKKRRRVPPNEIDRATRLMAQFLEGGGE